MESTFVIKYSIKGIKRTLTGDFNSPKEAMEYIAACMKEEGNYWHFISIAKRSDGEDVGGSMDSRFWLGCPELMTNFQPSSGLDKMLWQSADHVVSFGPDGRYLQKIIRRRNPEYTFGLDPADKDQGFTEDEDLPKVSDCMAHICKDNPDVAKLEDPKEVEEAFDDVTTEIMDMPNVPDKWDLIYDNSNEYSSDIFPVIRDKKLKGYAAKLEKAIAIGSISNSKTLYQAINKWQEALAKSNRFYSSPRNKYPGAQIARLWEIWNVKKFIKNPNSMKWYHKFNGMGMEASNVSGIEDIL